MSGVDLCMQIFFSLLFATLVLGESGPYTEALAAAKGAAAAVFDVIGEFKRALLR